MSATETNSLFNPTSVTKNPNQVMVELPDNQFTTFALGNPFSRDVTSFTTDQVGWNDLASTDKYVETFTWSTANTKGEEIYTKPIDFAFIKTLAPMSQNINLFSNFNSLMISIKNTENPFYQGMLYVFFDPSPSVIGSSGPLLFYPTVLSFNGGINQTLTTISQFSGVPNMPKNSGVDRFIIPINYPYQFFSGLPSPAVNAALSLDTQSRIRYADTYSFGRLRIVVYDPLNTMSPLNNLKFSVNASITNFTTAGLNLLPGVNITV
jgi:hypothetical protein